MVYISGFQMEEGNC